MNRRNFISKTVVAAVALPLVGLSVNKPDPKFRRVNIWRLTCRDIHCHSHREFLKNRPFKDVRRGDIVEVVAPGDAIDGLRYTVDEDATLGETKTWGFIAVPI